MSFTVQINADRCQGHGKCVLECPEAFDSDVQGFAVLTQESFPDDLRVRVQQCADDCPESAIELSSAVS